MRVRRTTKDEGPRTKSISLSNAYPLVLGLLSLALVFTIAGCVGVGDTAAGPTPVPTRPRPLATLTPGAARPAESFPPAPASAARGAPVFQKYCVNCHGEKADGDTTLARTLNPRPPNWHDAEFVRQRTPASLNRSIARGVLGTAMIGYEGTLSEQDRWDVLAWLTQQHTPPTQLERGATLYAQQCASCHGAQGAGGSASSLADPKTLAGRTGYSLFTAISGGLPGVANHSWESLPEVDRWTIVEHIWTFMYGP